MLLGPAWTRLPGVATPRRRRGADHLVTGTNDEPSQAAGAPRLRVMHVITHLDMGGAENVALGLIDALRDRVEFSLFAVLRQSPLSKVGQDMADRLARSVPFRFGTERGFKSGGVVFAARSLARAVAEQRPDLIHVHTEIPELTLAVAGLISRRVRRTPLLRTVHNSELWIAWGGIGRWVTQRLAKGDAVAVSRNAANADAAIVTRGRRPLADVIYNGVSPPAASPIGREAGPVRLLFAGRLVHQKGADLLPAILREAHARTPRRDVVVTIAGSGAMRDLVAQGLAEGMAGWDVRMTPPIERLSERLQEYDAVLLPSRFEGFALLPLEVLMTGIALVTTDAPGLDEAIPADYPFKAAVDDVAGIGAQLAKVIDDPATARVTAARYGEDLARSFSPEAMASAYLARYRSRGDTGAE
jgi:glycosyltransferase involved in cell wall biosynthesis